MLIVLSIAAAAALVVVAYSKLRQHSPETGTAGLRAVRDLADVVIVCVKAVEGVVDVLSRPPRLATGSTSQRWAYPSAYDSGYELEDEEL
ncbi:hypothetical protein [Humibacillus xanthopallidus]|uniref:Uncharacterized protein n=1 Tax=Humibacillus xanthopallidus TaxID=412689 RepID=A0A543HHM4_9MICO|nr:hypothetical protein [Humibacillus xanthopallidus]TQM57823.1 hypothetical protein FBY41_3158 [Humibacillus xanthopallidus]